MLQTLLPDIFTRYHAPTMRYHHLGFSSKDSAVLSELATAVKNCLPTYRVWDSNQLTEPMPPPDSSRFDWVQQTFNQATGLILVQPDDWFRRWSALDESAFWSALSTRHGGYPVVVIFADNHNFHRSNHAYLRPQELQGTAITLWISSKVSLSH